MVIYSIYFETVGEYIDLCMRQLYGCDNVMLFLQQKIESKQQQ